MATSTFAVNGGTVDFSMTVKNNSGEAATVAFFSGEVRGVAVAPGNIEFDATLLELPDLMPGWCQAGIKATASDTSTLGPRATETLRRSAPHCH